MGEQFCQQVLASALGELIGGGIVALIVALAGVGVAFYVGDRLGVRQWAKDQKERNRTEADTALRYIQLLEQEITDLLNRIPKQRQSLTEAAWGTLMPIAAPVWEVLRAAGHLARVVDPALLSETAEFYDRLAFVRQLNSLLAQTWLIDDRAVAHAPQLRTEIRDAADRWMGTAHDHGTAVLKLYDPEKARLRGLVGTAGDGDGDTTRRD